MIAGLGSPLSEAVAAPVFDGSVLSPAAIVTSAGTLRVGGVVSTTEISWVPDATLPVPPGVPGRPRKRFSPSAPSRTPLYIHEQRATDVYRTPPTLASNIGRESTQGPPSQAHRHSSEAQGVPVTGCIPEVPVADLAIVQIRWWRWSLIIPGLPFRGFEDCADPASRLPPNE